MLTEPELLSQHRAQLRIGLEACQKLKMNAVEPSPRGQAYADLVDALKKLEGTCRQMFHWRGDDARWIKLGAVYARALPLVQRLRLMEKWAAFGSLEDLFELGLRRVTDLAERPTGRSQGKLILPGDIHGWFEASKLRAQ
jgi:hypothetical protein